MLGRPLLARLLLIAMLAGGCGAGAGASDGRLEVVAAFYPLAEAAREVGGGSAETDDLTPSGVEPHDLELRPSDVGRIRDADLILYIGGGFQPALEDAIAASGNDAAAVDLLEGLPLRPGGHEDERTDPHVWLDPRLMIRIVERIGEELGKRLPGERPAFARNASAYARSIEELDRGYTEVMRTCERRQLVTAHAAFGYLAARYGLEQIPISGITPEAEPSPKRLQEVAGLAERLGVTTIYFETLVDPRVAASVARTVGARTAVLDPIEGLSGDNAGETYVTLMRTNLSALATGLGCKQA
jgi:zinc transport system substrate-binding protein